MQHHLKKTTTYFTANNNYIPIQIYVFGNFVAYIAYIIIKCCWFNAHVACAIPLNYHSHVRVHVSGIKLMTVWNVRECQGILF